MKPVALIGCGFVADLYLRSFALYPDIEVVGLHDRDPKRLAACSAHWSLPAFKTRDALFDALPEGALVLNLTNPSEHDGVTRAALEAGFHVWSEKPMVMDMAAARGLAALARSRGLILASAPASVLGEAAQVIGRALRSGEVGAPQLVYAELDDGYIPQAPHDDWTSESGAPWPARDEFDTGCTLEHAGYALSWLIAWFGPVARVTSAAANVTGAGAAPDYASATLEFENGVVARLTASIVASHDHALRVFTDRGVLKLGELWDNAAPVRFHKRFTIRRRLVEHPRGQRLRLDGNSHPKVKRFGAAAMNFALGPVEVLEAVEAGRPSRLGGDYALHLTEATLAIQAGGVTTMTTRCAPMEPMPWAR